MPHEDTDTQREDGHVTMEAKTELSAATQGTPRIVSNLQKLGENESTLPKPRFGTSSPQNYDRIHFVVDATQSLVLFMASPGNYNTHHITV